jgi:hypothetical protein
MRCPSLYAVSVVLGSAVLSLSRPVMAQETQPDTDVTARQARVGLPPLVASHRLERLAAPTRVAAGPCSARRAEIGAAIGAGIGLLSGLALIKLKTISPDGANSNYGTGEKVRDIAIPTGVLGTLGFFIADATKPSTCK